MTVSTFRLQETPLAHSVTYSELGTLITAINSIIAITAINHIKAITPDPVFLAINLITAIGPCMRTFPSSSLVTSAYIQINSSTWNLEDELIAAYLVGLRIMNIFCMSAVYLITCFHSHSPLNILYS